MLALLSMTREKAPTKKRRKGSLPKPTNTVVSEVCKEHSFDIIRLDCTDDRRYERLRG